MYYKEWKNKIKVWVLAGVCAGSLWGCGNNEENIPVTGYEKQDISGDDILKEELEITVGEETHNENKGAGIVKNAYLISDVIDCGDQEIDKAMLKPYENGHEFEISSYRFSIYGSEEMILPITCDDIVSGANEKLSYAVYHQGDVTCIAIYPEGMDIKRDTHILLTFEKEMESYTDATPDTIMFAGLQDMEKGFLYINGNDMSKIDSLTELTAGLCTGFSADSEKWKEEDTFLRYLHMADTDNKYGMDIQLITNKEGTESGIYAVSFSDNG